MHHRKDIEQLLQKIIGQINSVDCVKWSPSSVEFICNSNPNFDI